MPQKFNNNNHGRSWIPGYMVAALRTQESQAPATSQGSENNTNSPNRIISEQRFTRLSTPHH